MHTTRPPSTLRRPAARAPRPTLAGCALGLAASLAAVPAGAQSFGEAVLVVGDRILVGEAASERDPGSVYAFTRDGGEWTRTTRLQAPAPELRDTFGSALASSGDRLFVSAPGAADGEGVVYRLRRTGDGWEHAGRITRSGSSRFGSRLAASGEHLLVGTTDPETDGVIVLAYRASGDAWELVGELARPSETPDGAFGSALAVRGDVAVVGAPDEDQRAGAVYVFRFAADEGWRLDARLTPPADLAAGAAAGAAVAFAGEELLVGAPGTDRFRGAILRYAPSTNGAWSHAGTLVPDGLMAPAGFGLALAADGDRLFAGAPAVGNGMGRVYALGRDGGEWTLDHVLEVEGEGRIGAGGVLALAGDIGVLGLPADDFGVGSAWIASMENGRWRATERVVGELEALPVVAGGQVDCAEGAAERFECEAVDLLSFLPREALGAARGSRLNDVWGWTDPRTGHEYAIVGLMDGTAFVDVTDPYNPRFLGNLAKHQGSRANTWRDMKVYADHAFIVADGAGDHGMQVFDLRRLRDVTEPVAFEETAHYDGVESSHNIVINEETGFAYIVGASGGGETCGGGLHMVDIREPASPVFAGCFAHENTGNRGTGYSHDAQCVVYHGPDAEHQGREICIGANENALSISDVTEKTRPVAISTASYPNFAYTHQGWLTEDHRYFYSNDELDELNGLVDGTRTLVWDLSDLDDPTLVSEYYSPTRVTDHNLYVAGDRLYMSNNRAGLRVLDVSDPENPAEIGFFDTTPWSEDAAGFDGTWSVYPYFESGIILLSSRREGLFVVKPRDERLVP